uniref:Uncharacterized protein n=1 Tax=Anguilla anguilla TaxID=7936 RepID=A0A0E9W5C4_ANGAN
MKSLLLPFSFSHTGLVMKVCCTPNEVHLIPTYKTGLFC